MEIFGFLCGLMFVNAIVFGQSENDTNMEQRNGFKGVTISYNVWSEKEVAVAEYSEPAIRPCL